MQSDTLKIVSTSKYAGIVNVVVLIGEIRYTITCYDSPRLGQILKQFNKPGAQRVALNRLKKEAEAYKKDHQEKPKDWGPGCPSCNTQEPNYQTGAECPGCGFREWLDTLNGGQMDESYESQVWKYIVKEVTGQVVYQNDGEANAVEFCMDHHKPACVIKVLTRERIYQNY